MSNFKKITGKRIAKERKLQELSQEELAELSGLQRTYIGVVERGEISVGIENLKKISDALKIPLTKLFENY